MFSGGLGVSVAGECVSLYCCLTLVSGDGAVTAPTSSGSVPTAGL